MNIVLVKKDIDLFEKTAEVLIQAEADVYAIDAPLEGSNKYLEDIIAIKNEAGIDLLISFDYYPQISLAAGALNVKYACIVTASYEKALYDNSVLNPWNYIFTGDKTKAERLVSSSQKNVFCLPFPCLKGDVTINQSFTKNDENIREELYNKFKGLSQNIQGYLDGFMAVMRQDIKENAVFRYLNVKAREEIESKFEYAPGNTLENKAEYYDHNLLLPVLTGRTISLLKNVVEAEGISFEELENNDIVISIPDRNAGTQASFSEWQAISTGKFLIASSVTDYEILGEDKPVSYSDRFELTRLVKYYLKHEDERKEIALKVKEAALSKNTIEVFVGSIFDGLNT